MKGFILPLAVLILSIILSISFTVFALVFSSIQFSSLGRDSQKAFYAADGGVECALFWDIKHNAFSTTSPLSSINCAEQDADVNTIAGISSFSLNFSIGSCADVIIDKSSEPDTVIRSMGHNTCESGRPDRVERALEVTYEDYRFW